MITLSILRWSILVSHLTSIIGYATDVHYSGLYPRLGRSFYLNFYFTGHLKGLNQRKYVEYRSELQPKGYYTGRGH